MPVEVVSDEAGDAAALKLVRSVFMKGLAAAVVESMQAAEAMGRAAWLEQEIEALIGRPFLERALEGSRKHAARRVDEMEAARDLLARARGRAADRDRERGAARRARDDRGSIGSKRWRRRQPSRRRPTERARTLVRGAYDLHVHIAPDVPPRRIDDVSLARRFAEFGLAGFGLKSHYTSTAERAQVVSAVTGVEVVGTLTLNQAVGGMNPLAVEIAAREGARIVWMPTVDSPAETAGRTEPKPGDKVPQWARLQHELRELGLGVEPVHVTAADGRSCRRRATCSARSHATA